MQLNSGATKRKGGRRRESRSAWVKERDPRNEEEQESARKGTIKTRCMQGEKPRTAYN